MKKIHIDKLMGGILIATAIAVVACMVSLITLLSNGVRSELFHKSPSDDPKESYTASTKLSETPDYGQNYIKNMVFVGDLTVSEMRTFSNLSDAEIWTGESGDLSLDFSIDTATIVYNGTSMAVARAAELKKADYMTITLGLNNGVAYCAEDKFKSYYGKLIESVKESAPDTKIILQSVFPISKEKEKEASNLTNSKIDKANEWILELADQYGIRYLDTAAALKDKNGYLDEKYDSGNGVTLNEYGYNAMINYIRTHGYK